jgi:hypothetical protein
MGAPLICALGDDFGPDGPGLAPLTREGRALAVMVRRSHYPDAETNPRSVEQCRQTRGGQRGFLADTHRTSETR